MVVVNTGKKMPEIFNSSSQSQRLTGGPTANHADCCHEPEMEVEDGEEGEEVALQPECDQQTATTSAVPRRQSTLPQRGLPSLNGATFRGLSSGAQRHLRITLYVNGDRHFPGRPYVINLDRIKTVDLLCAELTRLLVSVKSLPSGVRYILDIDTGTAVQSVGELSVGGHYAVSSTVRLVRTLHYRSLNLLQKHLAAVAAAAASSASNTSNSSAVVDCSSSSLYESSKNGAKDSLLTRSTGAVSGAGGTGHHHHQHQSHYHQSHLHHHHKSAVFGLHHLSNSAHLPSSSSSSSGGRNCSPSSLGLKPNAASSSNGSSSLTLSASLSLHSNCGYLGGTFGRSTQAIRPKIVALLRGSCRATPHLRPSRRPIRLLLNYRIAQTFEQVINEISAAVVASQCNQQVQQQHHQLNVVGAVHRVYGLATNKKITSLDDFLVDNEHVYLVYGRTERCTLLDFMLDECEQREISAIIGGKSITNYQLPGELVKQQLYSGKSSQNNSENRAKNGQTTAGEGRAIRFHLTPKQSKKQCQAETAEEGSAAATSTSATKKHPQKLKQTKKQPQNLSKNLSSRDGNNNDKDVKAFSLPRNFLAHPKSARSYRSQKGSKKSDQRARTAGTREPFSTAKSNKLDFEQGHCTSATEEQTLKSLLDTEVSSSSSCFSSVYSLKEDGSESLGAGSRLGLPYDSHHFLKNSTSENVLGEAFYRHHLLPLYPANISNSLVYDSSHHHQKEQLKHHHHPHYLHQHSSSSPHSPHFSADPSDQQSDTTSSEDHNRGSNLVTSFSGSSSTTTTTTPGAASSVSCSEDFSNFAAAAAETEDYSSEMYSHLRQKQQQQQQSRHHTAALRSEESFSSSSDSSTPSFSSLSCTVRVPGQQVPPTSSVSGQRSNKTSLSKNGGGSSSSTSTNSTPKHRPNYSTSTTQKGTPQHHHHQRYSEFDLDDDEPPELLEGNDDDDDEEEEEDDVEEENDAENLVYEDEPPLPPGKRHLPLVPKREVARLYDIGKAIGDGKFGVVYTCSQRGSGRVYALKVVDKSAMMEMMAKSSQVDSQPRSLATSASTSSSSSANTEAAILKRISHPNIVKIYDHFEYVDQSYLVLELFKGGDLFDAISSAGRYGEADSLEMFRDLMEALAYLHRHHIIHRDIKLENLMVAFVPLTSQPLPPKSRTGTVNSQSARLSAGENNRRISSGIPGIPGGGNSSSSSGIPTRRYRQAIKLADFGLATEILPNELLFTVCGTPTYVAPEILLEIGYSYPVDIWAAGVIAFILLCGYPPFANEENNQDLLFDQILAGRFDFDDRHWAEVSDHAKALISDMLNTEQSARLTAEQVLRHSWLTKR